MTALPDEALMHADSVIVGEAEGVWKEILDDFVKGALKKRYYGQEVNLAELPMMRRDLFNKRFYYPGQFIETTRGCSVGCVFCGAQNFFGTNFPDSPARVHQTGVDGGLRTTAATVAMEEVVGPTLAP